MFVSPTSRAVKMATGTIILRNSPCVIASTPNRSGFFHFSMATRVDMRQKCTNVEKSGIWTWSTSRRILLVLTNAVLEMYHARIARNNTI
jgi:hypothetical protein